MLCQYRRTDIGKQDTSRWRCTRAAVKAEWLVRVGQGDWIHMCRQHSNMVVRHLEKAGKP